MTQIELPEHARYSFGGDEFLLVEIDDAMSLEANLRTVAIANGVRERDLDGIVEICPTNASLLIRFDPDTIEPERLKTEVQAVEAETKSAKSSVIRTRIIELPIWYGDPYTTEVMKRFREGFHQDPESTDLEYSARVNGLASGEEFAKRHSDQPWIVSMVGFVAGHPFLYQLVDREKQLQTPKYLSPRSGFTPALTVGHGGCFGSQYPQEGAGGYQMVGILVGPIFDPTQRAADFKESMFFYRPGDIVKYKPIGEEEYREYRRQVEAGTFRYRTAEIDFDAARASAEGESYNRTLVEALDGN